MASLEVWKPILGYEGIYEVSTDGNIRNFRNKKQLKPQRSGNGYFKVNLCKNGYVRHLWVHRLVAEAFLSNEDNLPVVDHVDGNKINNRADNLEWCSQKENSVRAWNNGFTPQPPIRSGEKHQNHVLTEYQVSEIRELYNAGLHSQRELAKRFSVSQTTIKMIVNNRAWKGVS